ncbi:MAG TPA: serine/threonine-protein kinase, partial [Gemmata sp.]|nr:serine/threonine-protein kinase [Gemmata sp.]
MSDVDKQTGSFDGSDRSFRGSTTGSLHESLDDLPVELAVELDRVCDEFEAAWQAGRPHSVEDTLGGIVESLRPAAIRELVALDVYYRREEGESIRTENYSCRFPELDLDWLDVVVAEADPNLQTTIIANAPTSRYELGEEIDRGGMGIVYRAKDNAFGREIAIKVLHEKFGPTSVAASRFAEEAHITALLQHPAIPPVYDLGTLSDGRPFLAMKLIKGETLDDQLANRPDPTYARGRFIAVFEQICQAIAYAHDRLVIHRDLKPANVMVGLFGEVQLMDWGLAKVLTSAEEDREEATEFGDTCAEICTQRDGEIATQAGSVMGTLSFIAPEQAGGEVEKIDKRSDVFGLGAVLCAILTGKPPYSARNTEIVRLLAIRGETTDAFVRLDASDADPELVALCKRCLAREREARPRDAGEVAKAVSANLAAVEERVRQAELDRVRAEERRKRRRVQLILAGAVLMVLALVGFGAGLASLWREAERSKADTEIARDEAFTLKGIADYARDEAIRLKGVAENAQVSETEARKAVEQEREKLAVVEYGRTMQVAHQEWRDSNVAATLALLDSTRLDLRGWEWYYVDRLCHSDLLTLKGHTDAVSSASFSADDSRIVTASADKTVKVWDAKTGTELFTLKGHTDAVSSASFSADGSRIVTASADKTVKVWDAKTGTELFTLKGH